MHVNDHTTHRFSPVIFYETPDIAASAAQGQPAAPVQPPQGQGQPQGGTGDFWHMYPNVPEEHRPLLEPVIRDQIHPYVTKLEQQYAPFKPFEGMTPDDATGLVQMAQQFEKDPVGVWLQLGEALFQGGEHLQEIDYDLLKQLATGQYVDPDEAPVGGGAVPPEIQQQLQELTAWRQQQEERDQQRQQQQVEQRQLQAYNVAAKYVKDQAVAAGYPAELLTDDTIRAAIIAAGGQREAAVQHFVQLRSGLLKGVTQQAQPKTGQPRLPNGTPPSRKERLQTGGNHDGFKDTRGAAEQYLKRQNAASAQG